MKKIFIITSVTLFAACNNSGDKAKVDSMKSDSTASTTATTMPDINSPYAVTYSSKFEMGDPKNAETVLNIWKDWDNGNLMNSKNSFADTVELHFSDGTMVRAARDSALAMGQADRDRYVSSVSTVDVVTSLKSTDKNENWALIWGEERLTDKKGKKDSSALHEAWRLNKDGKADRVFQFRARLTPPKKK